MADIAVVFHWDPAAMADFEISELMDWRERARLRNTAEQ
ncbi:GpE family phage tail protein [Glaciimonas sp. PCH181]|nr:GpE family phage tail protein [Glaciimonas sp. PCH181]PUA16834.1 GpE family phage tail protein [Glaciimonas sp. PCH181]